MSTATPEVMAIELRAERARLIGSQMHLANVIGRYYPRPAGQPPSLGEIQAREQAERNAARIAEIDSDLATLALSTLSRAERRAERLQALATIMPGSWADDTGGDGHLVTVEHRIKADNYAGEYWLQVHADKAAAAEYIVESTEDPWNMVGVYDLDTAVWTSPSAISG